MAAEDKKDRSDFRASQRVSARASQKYLDTIRKPKVCLFGGCKIDPASCEYCRKEWIPKTAEDLEQELTDALRDFIDREAEARREAPPRPSWLPKQPAPPMPPLQLPPPDSENSD